MTSGHSAMTIRELLSALALIGFVAWALTLPFRPQTWHNLRSSLDNATPAGKLLLIGLFAIVLIAPSIAIVGYILRLVLG